MSDHDDLVAALAPVSTALEKLGIRYYVGGSVASSFHGAARSTMDVDLVAEMNQLIVSDFLSCFGQEFYVSEAAVRDAIRRTSCFNLIHLPTSFKVDIFVSPRRPFDLSVMERAKICKLGDRSQLAVPLATAEDAILYKLEWYRKTNETSDRQWDDVSRLMKLLGDTADIEYLQRSAASIGVSDLLNRLIKRS